MSGVPDGMVELLTPDGETRLVPADREGWYRANQPLTRPGEPATDDETSDQDPSADHTVAELRAIAKARNVKIPAGANKEAILELLGVAADDETSDQES